MSVNFRTIGFPEHLLLLKQETFDLYNYQVGSQSMLSRTVRAGGLIEQKWGGDLESGTLLPDEWAEWSSLMARLEGQVVLFTLPVPLPILPRGAGAGFAKTNDPITITGTTIAGTRILKGGTTCLVAEAAPRYARAIKLKGLTPSTLVLTHGDVFGLGGNLYKVVSKVYSDDTGAATVRFRWRLWKPAARGDIVTLRRPTCRVVLKTANEGRVTRSAPNLGKAALSVMEVPYT